MSFKNTKKPLGAEQKKEGSKRDDVRDDTGAASTGLCGLLMDLPFQHGINGMFWSFDLYFTCHLLEISYRN